MKKDNKAYKIILHCFNATGHILPMQAVAKVLVNRGHEVVWLCNAQQEPHVVASGAKFFATQAVDRVDAELHAAENQRPSDGYAVIAQALFGGRLAAQVEDFRRVLAEFPADCLLNDALTEGAAAIYELGEASFYATLGVIPLYRTISEISSELVPRSGLGKLMTYPDLVLPIFNPMRSQLGLPPLQPSLFLHHSPLLHIQASCPSLEFEDPAHPPESPFKPHYVGPLVAPASESSLRPPWWADIENASRVIAVTQGTYVTDPSMLHIPAIEALSANANTLLVIPSPQVEKIRNTIPVPDNVRLAEWIPYDLLLPRCDILITNGG